MAEPAYLDENGDEAEAYEDAEANPYGTSLE
jgi:hypothetical protein